MAKAGFIYAHPDDETFMCACLIKQLAEQGETAALLLATKGDAGNKNGYAIDKSREELAEIRVKEMEEAARIMELPIVEHLGLPDGKLKDAAEDDFVDRVVAFIQKHDIKAVFTFPEDGSNGHPDHIAISHIVRKAVFSGRCPSVQKLYFTGLFPKDRRPSVLIDTKPQWKMKAAALSAHRSQILGVHRVFGDLTEVPEERRYEKFVLAWEKGVHFPDKQELSVLDGI
ncbi:PIG-L deacetylase family protein [Paenibacillus thalictri]|uniref:PIG-L family deacetylase n=1 Tax=Paenibacillus thalictri TaxID=2527873 RepID=A0A4Q9DP09_9BACL|nr:PIG-L family deacetylase [Paenibacillus thalictri]TBL77826.1 PIG-L family deacetylase [Paenibacillus thalictri]